jgi:GT2 family glycosyltransferase
MQHPTIQRWPSVTVVVVGYNSRAHLATCFTALERQRYDGVLEVCFIDNASVDGSCEHVAACFPEIRVIPSGANLGYAGGNNLGAWMTCGEVIVFLNPDTEPEPEAIRELVRPLVAEPSIGMTTATLVLFDARNVVNTAGNALHLSGVTVCRLAGKTRDYVIDADVSAVSGACCAIRRALFERLGGFDEAFFLYLEDTDLSWRVRLAGYRCRVAARAVVAHHYRLTLGSEKVFWLERNRFRMLLKNLAPSSIITLLPLLLFTEVLTLGWSILSGPRHVWAKMRAYIWMLNYFVDSLKERRRVQQLRTVNDYVLLRDHTRLLPIAGASNGIVGRMMVWSTAPIALALSLIAITAALLIANRLPLNPTCAEEIPPFLMNEYTPISEQSQHAA